MNTSRIRIIILLLFAPYLAAQHCFAQNLTLSDRYKVLDEIGKKPSYEFDSVDISNHYSHSMALYKAGKMDSAIYFIQQVLPKVGAKSTFYETGYLTMLANIETVRTNYSRAISYLNKANEVFLNSKKYGQVSITYGNISSIYSYIEDHENTEKFALLSIDFAKRSGDTLNKISSALINLANVYSETNRINKALKFYQRAMTIDSLNNDLYGVAIISCNIGLLQLDIGNENLGLKYILKSYEIDSTINDVSELVGTHHYLGVAYLKNNLLNKAKYHLLKSEELFNRTGISNYQRENYHAQLELAIALRNDSLANSVLTKQQEFIDSLLSKQRADALAEAELKSDSQRLKFLSEKKSEELQHKDLQLLLLSLLATTFILVLVVLMVIRKRTLALNETLANQKQELEVKNEALNRLIKEKDDLMGIVAHDLKSPFTGILGLIDLLDLQSKNTSAKDEMDIQGMIKQLSSNGMKLIDDLTTVGQLEDQLEPIIEEKVDIDGLIDELIFEFNSLAKTKNQNIIKRSEGEILTRIDLLGIKRIIRNLLSNALKYSPKYADIVIGSLKSENTFKVYIIDRGPGFTEKDKTRLYTKFAKLSARPTGNEHSSGLGLYTVKLLTDRLGGEVELISDLKFGSEFIVSFPLKN